MRHLVFYDELSPVLEKASAAANAEFGLAHGITDLPVDHKYVDEMFVLVANVDDYLDHARKLLDDWHGASPSGDGPSANPPAAWHAGRA